MIYILNVKQCGLKANITIVCAHTANATWFFPAIIVVTSNIMQKFQCCISRLFVSSISMLWIRFTERVAWKFWFTNEISKRRLKIALLTEAEWMSSSVLHCNVTVAAWPCENTRDVGAALQCSGEIGGKWKQFSAKIFRSRTMTS